MARISFSRCLFFIDSDMTFSINSLNCSYLCPFELVMDLEAEPIRLMIYYQRVSYRWWRDEGRVVYKLWWGFLLGLFRGLSFELLGKLFWLVLINLV